MIVIPPPLRHDLLVQPVKVQELEGVELSDASGTWRCWLLPQEYQVLKICDGRRTVFDVVQLLRDDIRGLTVDATEDLLERMAGLPLFETTVSGAEPVADGPAAAGRGRVVLLLGVLLLAAVGSGIPFRREWCVPALLRPVERRTVAAPLGGAVLGVFARDGDWIPEGAPLLEVAGEDLRPALAALRQDLRKLEALSPDNAVAVENAQTLRNALQSQLAALEHLLLRQKMYAPMAGRLDWLKGGLEPGARIQYDEDLALITSSRQVQLEFAADPARLRHIQAGQAAKLRLTSSASGAWSCVIQQVDVLAPGPAGQHVLLRVRLDDDTAELKTARAPRACELVLVSASQNLWQRIWETHRQ